MNQTLDDANLKRMEVKRKSGQEAFHFNGEELGFHLLDFWQWNCSDLVSNALRGVLAEYLVGCALGIVNGVRQAWSSYDLLTNDGLKLEVKSAAYLQSWSQKRLSSIKFSITPTLGWDADTNEYSRERKRQADIYVFALLKHPDKSTIDPLNLEQWDFYVLPAAKLDSELVIQASINLGRLKRLSPVQATYHQLAAVVKAMSAQIKPL